MGYNGFSAFLLILVVTGCLGRTTPDNTGWKPLSVELRRVIGSVYTAAKTIGVTPILPVISAYGKDRRPGYNMYRVTFKASRPDGREQTCWAEVHWDWNHPTGLKRFVKSWECWP